MVVVMSADATAGDVDHVVTVVREALAVRRTSAGASHGRSSG